MRVWQELRRRQMFRLVGLYVVGAWAIIEVAGMMFQAWGIPDSAIRYLFMAAVLCFPITLLFGWIFDIRKDGIYRTRKAGPDEIVETRLRSSDYLILAALIAVGIVILLGSAERVQDEIIADAAVEDGFERRDNSIAVLPFANLDADGSTQYFSDGITEEIQSRLSTLKALHVITSKSSFALRDSDKGPAHISGMLGVKYLLQGSVRRDGDFVRIIARLVDHEGRLVWSKPFERELKHIFSIQAEIARTVANQIRDEVIPIEELPAGRTTSNMAAYNEFLVGRRYVEERTASWRENAVPALRRAIELDPEFAPPYAWLGIALTVMSGFGPQWDEGRELAEKALQLDPDLAIAHAAYGLTSAVQDRKRAEESLKHAVSLDPSLGFAYNLLEVRLERQGRIPESIAWQEKGLAVDPLNPPLVMNTAMRESLAGNFKRAESLMLRLASLPEPPQDVFSHLYLLYEEWGYIDSAVAMAKEQVRLMAPTEPLLGLDELATAYGCTGMTAEADYWLERLGPANLDDGYGMITRFFILRSRRGDTELAAELGRLANLPIADSEDNLVLPGMINLQLQNYPKGVEQLETGMLLASGGESEPADAIDLSAMQWNPELVVLIANRLAYGYQQVGRTQDATDLLEDVVSLLDALDIKKPVAESALVHALNGDFEKSFEELSRVVGLGWSRYYEASNDPAWAEALSRPEFRDLLGKVKAKVDQQRANVEAIEAQEDFRSEYERLVATSGN